MEQLSFASLPLPSEPEITKPDDVNAPGDVNGPAAPKRYGPEFYEEMIMYAVLDLNEAERELKVTHSGSPLIETLVHAQDWLCRDLPERMHWVLREL